MTSEGRERNNTAGFSDQSELIERLRGLFAFRLFGNFQVHVGREGGRECAYSPPPEQGDSEIQPNLREGLQRPKLGCYSEVSLYFPIVLLSRRAVNELLLFFPSLADEEWLFLSASQDQHVHIWKMTLDEEYRGGDVTPVGHVTLLHQCKGHAQSVQAIDVSSDRSKVSAFCVFVSVVVYVLLLL